MRIAVTYDNGTIFQHFGRTENFKIYDVENGTVVATQMINSNGQGHGALAYILSDNKVDVLICGGIGAGAKNALANANVTLFGGCSGDCDKAVEAFLANRLNYDANVQCDHHDHEEGHECGEHGCGGHEKTLMKH